MPQLLYPEAYYNDFNLHACHWLMNLRDAGLITGGKVDAFSITRLMAMELKKYMRVHLFAGIGGWDHALNLAGWPRMKPIWTGSCPCQPYSSAGKGLGDADARNLWPEMFRLIRGARPEFVLGEQVESAIGHGWLDGISADLEAEGYAVGAVVLGAHSAGAPHIRQRLYWMAHDQRDRPLPAIAPAGRIGAAVRPPQSEIGMAFPDRGGAIRRGAGTASPGGGPMRPDGCDQVGDTAMADPTGERSRSQDEFQQTTERRESQSAAFRHAINHWADAEVVIGRDERPRRIESGLEPLVDGIPFRLADGRTEDAASWEATIHGIGNAIVPQVAALFIRAIMDEFNITPELNPLSRKELRT